MQNMIYFAESVCYNRNMPVNVEKLSEQILMNVTPSTFKLVEKIAAIEGRPNGYIVRKLMTRGMDLYLEDGKLEEIDSKEAAIAAVREGIRRAIPENIGEDELVEVRDNIVAHIGSPKAEAMSREEIRRTINADDIAEIERRVTPRKTQSIPVLKKTAK